MPAKYVHSRTLHTSVLLEAIFERLDSQVYVCTLSHPTHACDMHTYSDLVVGVDSLIREQFVPELLPYFEISSAYSKGHEQD